MVRVSFPNAISRKQIRGGTGGSASAGDVAGSPITSTTTSKSAIDLCTDASP